jgi:uncharacterized protein
MKQKPLFILKRSSIHSQGVFAACDIAKGTRIIEYVGERITRAEGQRRTLAEYERHLNNPSLGAVYVYEVTKRHSIDGNVPYNTARHVNHSCDPNADSDVIRGKIWIIAIKDIKAGEEITYNYGYDFIEEEYTEHPCRCGTKRCVGFILHKDVWPQLRKALKKQKSSSKRDRAL